MANPLAWIDEIVNRRWLAVLSGPAVKILVVQGRFFDRRTQDARTDALTLQRLAGLGRSTFYEALAELKAANLVEIESGTRAGKFREYPVHIYRLTQPVPRVPPGYHRPRGRRKYPLANADTYSSSVGPHAGTKSSALADKTVRMSGQSDGQKPRRKQLSAIHSPTDSTQLGSKGTREAEKVVKQCLPAGPAEAVRLVQQWAAAVARAPSMKERRVREAVGAVSQRFNLPAPAVREALERAAAVLHPLVSRAVEIFDGRVIGVERIEL